jgi:hypothetical protein
MSLDHSGKTEAAMNWSQETCLWPTFHAFVGKGVIACGQNPPSNSSALIGWGLFYWVLIRFLKGDFHDFQAFVDLVCD